MIKSTQTNMNSDWKDRELDEIWHHGIVPAFYKGKGLKDIDQYELISIIEKKIEKIVERVIQTTRKEVIEKLLDMGKLKIKDLFPDFDKNRFTGEEKVCYTEGYQYLQAFLTELSKQSIKESKTK